MLSLIRNLMLFTAGILAFQAHSHGDHIYYQSPTAMQAISNQLQVKLVAPYSDIEEIHINIHQKGSNTSQAQYFLVMNEEDKSYSINIDVSDWEKGTYCSKVTQLGAVHAHNPSVCFLIDHQ